MHKVASSLLIVVGAFAVGSAQSAPIQITALPYTIVAPGTYVVATYLSGRWPTATSTAEPDIIINVNVSGKVVLDLNGCNLIPYEGGHGDVLGYSEDCIDVLAGEDITIKNGSIGSGEYGFGEGISVNPQGTSYLSNIKITDIGFNNAGEWGILFNSVNSSTVTNCSFIYGGNGISDINSKTGNTYSNIGIGGLLGQYGIAIGSRTGGLVKHCKVESN